MRLTLAWGAIPARSAVIESGTAGDAVAGEKDMRTTMTTLAWCACIAVCLPGGLAVANDTSVGDDNGTLVFQRMPDVRMASERLVIARDRVEVDYVFLNTGKREVTTTVAFPMPPVYLGHSDHNAIADFALTVDGKPQTTERSVVVRLDGRDISKTFAATGWSVDDVADFVGSGELPKGHKPLPKDWFDQNEEPRFTVSEYFTWRQTFRPGVPVAIRHVYTPSVTTGVPQPADFLLGEYRTATCIDPAMARAIRKRETDVGVSWGNLRYILKTANNWQGPIGDFHLTIRKPSADAAMSLCFDGDLRKTSPTTFEFAQKDFVPARDIDILFVE